MKIHYPKPRVVSITQPTELGTVYSAGEVKAIADIARRCNLRVHMDGSRFANAVVALNEPPRVITGEAGVDVLCLGATKNGSAIGEAVVFFNRELAWEFDYRCKQAGQLASKMRFLSAPWVGMLQDGAWLRHAAHANRMAQRLEEALRALPAITILIPRQVNSVFVQLPIPVIASLRERGWIFYTFIGQGGCRFMCSWDATEADIDRLVADLQTLV